MAYPGTTDWPTSVDVAVIRTDNVDTVFDEDFNYQDSQVRAIQAFLGVTGRLIGAGAAGQGVGGAVSPIADGAAAVAFKLVARDDFSTPGSKLLSLGDDYDAAPPAYTQKFGVDGRGILELTPTTLPAAGVRGRVAYNLADDALHRDNGVSWDAIGGGGGGVRDVAGVVVGNTAAGDTFGVTCDVIDALDNAAAMKTAIESASSGDVVYIRSGTYDFRVPGGPTARISIPAGVTVLGAGMGAVVIKTNDTGANHDGRAFVLGAGARLMDITVEASEPTAGQAGFGAVIELGDDAEAWRVEVEFANNGWSGIGAPQAFWPAISGCFAMIGNGVKKLVDCRGTNVYRANDVGGSQQVDVASAAAGSLSIVHRLVCNGGDRGVSATTSPVVVSTCRIVDTSSTPVVIGSGASYSKVLDNQLICNEPSVFQYAIELTNVNRCTVQGNYLEQGKGAVGNYAIDMRTATYCVIVGNTGNGVASAPGGWEDILNALLNSDNNIFGANNFGNGAGYIDSSAGNVILGGVSGVVMSIETGRYDYSSPAGSGPEEVVGQFMFDASKAPGTVKMRCMMSPTLAGGDQAEVHVDDIGAPGAPAAPTRVTNTTTHGLVIGSASAQQDYKETAAFTLAGGPSPGVLAAGPRMYEVVITITGGNGAGTVDLGFAGLYVEV